MGDYAVLEEGDHGPVPFSFYLMLFDTFIRYKNVHENINYRKGYYISTKSS